MDFSYKLYGGVRIKWTTVLHSKSIFRMIDTYIMQKDNDNDKILAILIATTALYK